jgi:hypothetical protein
MKHNLLMRGKQFAVNIFYLYCGIVASGKAPSGYKFSTGFGASGTLVYSGMAHFGIFNLFDNLTAHHLMDVGSKFVRFT